MSLENGESQADEQPKDDEPVPAEEPRGGLIGAMQRRLGPSVTSALMLGVFVVVGAALFVLVVVGINRWMTGDQEGPVQIRPPSIRNPLPTVPGLRFESETPAPAGFKPATATPPPPTPVPAVATPTPIPPRTPTPTPVPTLTPVPLPENASQVLALFDKGTITADQANAMLRELEAKQTLEPPDTPEPTPEDTPMPPNGTLLQLADPLDEPEFYCVDVVGTGDGIMLDRPLQAHTCKPGSGDQLFQVDTPSDGQVYLSAYNHCLEVREQSIYLSDCSDTPMQKFEFGDDGAIKTVESGDCLTVAAGEGEEAGGPSHVRRDLLVSPCEGLEPALTRWVRPGDSPDNDGGAS